MSEKTKLERILQVFEAYDRRFAQAALARPALRPWVAEEREQIMRTVKEVLCFRDDLVPQIRVRSETEVPGRGYTIRDFCCETWDRFYAVSSFYCPDGLEGNEKRPLVFICPGHGKYGRRTESYQQMAIRLVRQGACVLLIENIGQGDRQPFGHGECAVPFACGLTLQGMILMETVAVIRWAMNLPHVDASRMGACGNSGGGTLTCFLSALAPELAAIASSGYPSSFDYVMRKEKKHCCCNLLPHVSAKLEMWQVYGVFAPKSLLLEQGRMDHFFPSDLFYRIVRRVKGVYGMEDSPDAFAWFESDVGHSWQREDRDAITAFLGRVLDMPSRESTEAAPEDLRPGDVPSVEFPEDAIGTDEAAMRISGIRVKPDIRLEEIYPPMYQGRKIRADEVQEKNVRDDVMRILAQMEMAL